MNRTYIGIDLGGTNLRIGAVRSNRKIQVSQIIDSNRVALAGNPLRELRMVIDGFIRKYDIKDISAISIGVPSSVANDKKTVICTTNLRNVEGTPIFHNADIATYLQESLGAPVFVNNDTKNILLYDVYANALEKEKIVIGIYIGTGVGASVLIDGKCLDGAYGAALDLGHVPYFRGKEKCSCSKYGCCECYTSGWKLQKIREEYYPEDDIEELFVKHWDEKPLQEFVYSCAHIFAVMATIFNPNTIIAGGGVMEMKGFPREEFERIVDENTGLDVMNYGFRYLYSEPMMEKGVIGAAIFAEQRMEQDLKGISQKQQALYN